MRRSGWVLWGGGFALGGYRYGFNGKENDNEIKGEGNQQDYGERIYDPRIAKFLSVDPVTYQYPELTPYQFASNSPVQGIDFDGLELVNSNNDPKFLKIVGGRATLATLTATAVTRTAAELGKRMAVNAAGELITTTGVTIGGSTVGAALMTVGLTILPMSMGNPEGSQSYVDRQNEVMNKIKANHGQSHIEEFRDPSELSDDYLRGVADRISLGTASGQDHLYQSELLRRQRGAAESNQPSQARSLLSIALSRQDLENAPNGLKETWTEGNYNYEVRIHGPQTNAPAGSNSALGTTFRVARRLIGVDANGQGFGWEYADDHNNWYKQKDLKSGANSSAGNDTHIPLNR